MHTILRGLLASGMCHAHHLPFGVAWLAMSWATTGTPCARLGALHKLLAGAVSDIPTPFFTLSRTVVLLPICSTIQYGSLQQVPVTDNYLRAHL